MSLEEDAGRCADEQHVTAVCFLQLELCFPIQ